MTRVASTEVKGRPACTVDYTTGEAEAVEAALAEAFGGRMTDEGDLGSDRRIRTYMASAAEVHAALVAAGVPATLATD